MDYTQLIYEWLSEVFAPVIEQWFQMGLVYGALEVGSLLTIVFLFAFNTVRRKR